MTWSSILQQDAKIKLTEALEEYTRYKNEEGIIYLQQAGNKLFSAIENYLMLKHITSARNFQHLKQIIKNNPEDKLLLSKAVQLHYFFYNAQLQMEHDDADNLFQELISQIKPLIL